MIQDSKGQLYFLTSGGLSIYDGTGFNNFTVADGLASDVVNDAIEMGPDSIWIATNEKQLNYLSHGKIRNFKTSDGFCPVINSFYKSQQGQLFAASDAGLFIFNNNRFIKLPLFKKKEENGDEFLNSIFQVGNYLMLIADPLVGKNRGNVLLYDINQATTVQILKDIHSNTIVEVEGEIFLTTDHAVQAIDKKQLQTGKIIFKPLPIKFRQLKDVHNGFLLYDGHKNFWGTLADKGLLKINDKGDSKLYAAGNGLLSNKVTGLFEDKESGIWIIDDNYGVQKLVGSNVELISRPFGSNIKSLATNVAGDSVYFWDNETKKIFLQTANNCVTYQLKNVTEELNSLAVSGSNLYLNSSKRIYHFTIAQLAKGIAVPRLIYTYDSGYHFYNSVVDANGVVTVLGEHHLTSIINSSTISRTSIRYFADEAALDNHGRLWFASRAAELYVLTPDLLQPKNYLQLAKNFSTKISVKAPRSITVDKLNNVWIGTRDDGLYCYGINKDLQIHLLKHLTKKDGLTDNFITYLYCDKSGTVWAGTSSGIDKIIWNNADCIIDNISKRSNLYPFIFSINEDDNHNIFALTNDGNLVKISVTENRPAAFTPQLFIKSINTDDSVFSVENTSASFSYKQNNISFYVASPSFNDEKQTRYSYVLEGSGKYNWSEPTASNALHFYNLAAGNYTLKIKSVYPVSRYPDQVISYSFRIRPPYWQTWWFRIIAVLVTLIGFTFLIRMYYIHKLQKQKIILEKQQAVEKERTRIATDMHDDLGAGLSKIRFLSETVQRNISEKAHQPHLLNIVNSSVELVDKFNEIIWAMNEKNNSLEDLLYYIRNYTAKYCFENNLNYNIAMPDNITLVSVTSETRRHIFLTVKEALHNVVKHAKAKKVCMSIQADIIINISINDDGKGFKFSESKNLGNGLSSMQQRIKNLNGELLIENREGTTLTITVPIIKT